MKRRLSLAVTAVALLFQYLVSCSSSPELKDSVRAYEEAYNSHNLEAIVGLFTNDPVFELKGSFTINGKQALRDMASYDIALDIRMSIGGMETRGDTVFAHLTETNNWLEVAGIGEAHYQVEFVFKDGAIQELLGTATPETATAYQDVFQPMMEWARRDAPDRIEEMMPDGRFEYTAENAERSLALLEDWKRAAEDQTDSTAE